MKLGVDFGSSFIKLFVSHNSGIREYKVFKTSEVHLLMARLAELQPERVGYVGAGFELVRAQIESEMQTFEFVPFKGPDPIGAEVQAQVKGARHQLLLNPISETGLHFSGEDAIVVSIGSGVSYAVSSNRIAHAAIGNPLGGSALSWAALQLRQQKDPVHISAFEDMELKDPTAGTVDLYVKDLIPATKDLPIGSFVASHFGNLKKPSVEREWRSAVDLVVVGIVKDLMDSMALSNARLEATGSYNPIPDIIAIGGAVEHIPCVAERLAAWCALAGMRLHIPKHPGHAGAIGAALYLD